MIGDGPQLLTHYYDDARTMYQVFRRGLSISGERGYGVCRSYGGNEQVQMWGGASQVLGAWEESGTGVQRRKTTVSPSPAQLEK